MTTAELPARAGEASTRLHRLVVALVVAAAPVLVVAGNELVAVPPHVGVLAVATVAFAAVTAVPFLAQHGAGDHDRHGYGAIVVPAALLLPWYGLVAAATVGGALGWPARRIPGLPGAAPATRSSEIGAALARVALAATAAGLVAGLPAADRVTRLVLATAAAAVFLVVDRIVTAAVDASAPYGMSRHRSAGARMRAVAVEGGALATGILAALVAAAYAAPAVTLAVQAAATTTFAVLLSTADTGRARHAALLRIAAHAHASMDVTAVERAVERTLGPLVRAGRVEIRDLPPSTGEVGVPLPLESGDPRWLVATHRLGLARGFLERDHRLLTSVAPLVATAVENALMHGSLTALAATDPLTGVANRRTFEEQVVLRLRHARITDGATALVVLDLDEFKAINDDLGHGAGDELLVEIARRLKAAARRDDLVARLGGDEFAVVASLTTVAEAGALTDRLADHLGDLHAADGRRVGTSLGVAVAPHDGRSLRDLYDAADERMYAVKQRAR